MDFCSGLVMTRSSVGHNSFVSSGSFGVRVRLPPCFAALSLLLGRELGFADPPGLDASLHDEHFAFLAAQIKTLQKSRVAGRFAILALGPAREVVGGATGKVLYGLYAILAQRDHHLGRDPGNLPEFI